MSLRSRKVLASAGRWLALDAALVTLWHWGHHSTWAAILPRAAGLLVISAGFSAYAWWWYGDPGRLATAQRLREERSARRQM